MKDRGTGKGRRAGGALVQRRNPPLAPGRRTLVQRAPGRKGTSPVPGKRTQVPNGSAPSSAPAPGARDASTMWAELARKPSSTREPSSAATIAEAGLAGPVQPLPHKERIQAAFGKHDVSQVRTRVGGAAAEAAGALGATAYATGTDVAFREPPDLHTAAHEAAHVVQQRAGVSLKDGMDRGDDAYERHADRVADAVVSGRSAETLLDRTPAGSAGGVQRLREAGADFVGGDEENAVDLVAPGADTAASPAQGEYLLALQEATGDLAPAITDRHFDQLRLEPVQPNLGQIDRHIAIATWEADYYKDQQSSWSNDFVNGIWEDRESHARSNAETFAEDKRAQQANFQSYNAFVPLANSLVEQVGRIAAQQAFLGITDDAEMVEALTQRLGEAEAVGQAERRRHANQEENAEPISAPSGTDAVTTHVAEARDAAREMDAAYVNFQQVLISREQEELRESGADAEAELQEIQEIQAFLRNVGRTIDIAHPVAKKGPTELVNAIAPNAETAMSAIGDIVFYQKVTEIQSVLDNIEGRIQASEVARQFAAVSAKTRSYRASVQAYGTACRALHAALHDRRQAYAQLGIQLDRADRGDKKNRYANMLALVVELRQAVALARFVQSGLGPLEASSSDGGESEPSSRRWGQWAVGVVERRNRHAHWMTGPSHPTVRMPEPEQQQLEAVFQNLQRAEQLCQYIVDTYGPVDAAAGDLMQALGGMRDV